ncbi:MAG: FAD-dependent oxidoreductase [Pseudomonadota bacterium]
MSQEIYDVVIFGTGPAGLQAAIHAARAKASVLVMGRKYKSSLYKAHVENYCCLSGVSGEELLKQGVKQASDSGARFLHEESDVIIHLGRKVKNIAGEDKVQGLYMDNNQWLDVEGVFIETGAKGAVELAAALGVALDDESFQYIVTDKKQQTNMAGVYAAGDICGPPWQMAKAVGEGCVAGLSAAKYAKKVKQEQK